MITRRDFIKMLGIVGAAILSPLDRIGNKIYSKKNYLSGNDVGEEFAGFLLLPDGADTPEFVLYPKSGIPIFCGVGDGPSPTASGVTVSIEDLSEKVNFKLYKIANQIDNLAPLEGTIIYQPDSKIFCITIDYGRNISESNIREGGVSIWAYSSFPYPYPIWSSDPVEINGPFVKNEKVEFLPMPGVLTITPTMQIAHWIENDILYKIIIDPCTDISYSRSIVDALGLL